jgi:hypothetical protein
VPDPCRNARSVSVCASSRNDTRRVCDPRLHRIADGLILIRLPSATGREPPARVGYATDRSDAAAPGAGR